MTGSKDQAQSLLLNALEMPTEKERAAYLEAQCGADSVLRAEVDELLDHARRLGNFLAPAASETGCTVASLIRERQGDRIGPYKLLQQIGEGGMGVVFMAEQSEPIQRTVALKIIKPGMDTRQVIARFEAERQALAMMDHPNIARVLDAGATETGRPYFVMDLVKGVPITEYCDQLQLPVGQRLELMTAVCNAVQHAHQKGIIHRDIKPSNVLVAEFDGKPVPTIIDFGVAKATAQRLTEKTMFTEYGQLVGTFEYMSPEQARFNQLDVDTRSDVYSLGVLLYELLTGSTPIEKERLRSAAIDELLRIIREEEPPKPSTRLNTNESLPSIAANRAVEPKRLSGMILGELDWIVMKCLAKERNERYGSALDLAADLKRWLCDEPLSIRTPDVGYLLRMWVRRNFGSTGWAIALGVIWGILAGFTTWFVMLNPWELSLGPRRIFYLLCIAWMGGCGLINVWLIRPKNAKADLLAGTLTGVVGAVLCNAISWSWVAVIIAGLPQGIWLGTISSFIFMGAVSVFGTVSAGRLLRQHGHLRGTFLPYAELSAPSLAALVFWNSVLFNIATRRWADWEYFLAVAALSSVAGVAVFKRWPWPVRVLLHAAWIASLLVFVTQHVPH